MFATIMVPALGDGSDQAALNMAMLFGQAFGSHVDFVRIHTPVRAEAGELEAYTPFGYIDDSYVKLLQRADAEMTERANEAFAKARLTHKARDCTDPEGRGELTIGRLEFPGSSKLVTQARYYDLIVTAGGPEGRATDLVVESGRPVLLAPAKAPESVARTVAIGWKETAEAARAVTAAMPLLCKAERVVVIAANEIDGGATQTAQSANRLAAQLAWHGIKAEPHSILSHSRPAQDAVLDMAAEVHADVLVMGAYGHSRTTEFIFGGFTRHVLHNETLPVFLMH